MSIVNKYKVVSIDSYLCKDWLLYKHYAKRIPSISYSFGLYSDNLLIGILTIGKPASPQLCDGICGKEYSSFVYELNRLCINDGLEKNVLSYFVSKCLKLINKNMILVSYADTKMNHNGYIYQATNWIYTGATKERTDIGFEDGSHSRHYDKNIDGIQWIKNNFVVNPPRHIDKKNPTHVEVHSVQLIKSPKNFEFFLINSLVDSKIDPHTNIEVIPYAIKIQKNKYIIFSYLIKDK